MFFFSFFFYYSYVTSIFIANLWDGHDSFFFLLVLCFWIQGLTLPRLVLYHLSYILAPFALDIFEIGSCIFAWAGLDCNPPAYVSHIAWMTGTYHHTCLGWDGVLLFFCSGWPRKAIQLSSWDYRYASWYRLILFLKNGLIVSWRGVITFWGLTSEVMGPGIYLTDVQIAHVLCFLVSSP
jgi:hypothetical protein